MIEFRNIHIKSFNYSTRQAKRTGQNTSFPRFQPLILTQGYFCAISNKTDADEEKCLLALHSGAQLTQIYYHFRSEELYREKAGYGPHKNALTYGEMNQ